jgi:hypothetical protein
VLNILLIEGRQVNPGSQLKPICGWPRCRSGNWCSWVHGSVLTSARPKSRSKQQWSQQPWLKRYRSQSIALRAGVSALFASAGNIVKSANQVSGGLP